jgi:hypothetical protein
MKYRSFLLTFGHGIQPPREPRAENQVARTPLRAGLRA